jgi:two-component system, NarL family, response regulator NreC
LHPTTQARWYLRSAVRRVREKAPQVLVLDLGMVQGSSREAIGRLRAPAPDTQVVVLSMDERPVAAQHLLASGAAGFVLKDRADDDLAQAVPAAARGEQYINERVAERLNGVLGPVIH